MSVLYSIISKSYYIAADVHGFYTEFPKTLGEMGFPP